MDPLILIVEQLVAARAGGLDKATEIVGAPFALQAEVSTPYFDVYAAAPPSNNPAAISHVEVRVPKGEQSLGMVIVDVNTNRHCLEESTLIERYGKPRPLDAPSPRTPQHVPIYREYSFRWGELRFGMERSEKACCQRVVADFVGK